MDEHYFERWTVGGSAVGSPVGDPTAVSVERRRLLLRSTRASSDPRVDDLPRRAKIGSCHARQR